MSSSTDPIEWFRYPFVATDALAKAWLTTETLLGLAPNTLDAYARGLDDFLGFCQKASISPATATRADLARYVGDLRGRPRSSTKLQPPDHVPTMGLSNATLQQRLTAVRLFFDFLIEEGKRADHPVGRGRYTPGKSFGADRERALVPRFQTLPWIPSDEQWHRILQACKREPLRNRVMLAMSYDAALRREEVCSLETTDIDPARRLLRIRAEATKGRRERMVPYSAPTGEIFGQYLRVRRELSRERGRLFLSESCRNLGQPISLWGWSKAVRRMARRCNVLQFTPHTLRHLCLTDLARANWDIHEIATFAGHRSVQTTLLYIHLSGRDLSRKLASGMAQIHAQRTRMLAEMNA